MTMDNLVDSEHDLTQVVETSVNINSNSPSQDYTHPYDDNLPLQVLNCKSGQHSRFHKWLRGVCLHSLSTGLLINNLR